MENNLNVNKPSLWQSIVRHRVSAVFVLFTASAIWYDRYLTQKGKERKQEQILRQQQYQQQQQQQQSATTAKQPTETNQQKK